MEIKDLTWDNYLKLNDEIRSQDFLYEYFSPVVIIQWKFYGFNFKYHQTNDFIIIYLFHENINNYNHKWVVFASYYKQDLDLTNLKSVIKHDLMILNNSNDLSFSNLLTRTISDWKLENYKIENDNYISNYIYEIDKMKTFSGKKLQKKRNHLNAFIKDNHNTTIKDYREVDVNEIIEFCKYHIEKYSEVYRAYELDVYKQYLLNEAVKDKRYFGTVIYIDNKIVGFTFGFLNYDTFEVIIEKAERDIRGLYQFLIVKNLEYHNVNVKYMDREDDAGLEPLAKSKKSYYPLIMVERFDVKDVKGWFDEDC